MRANYVERSNTEQSKDSFGSKIDYKILIIIIGLGIAYHVINNSIKDITEEFNVIDVAELLLQSVVIISTFIVARMYWPSKVFGKAYVALGIAFTMWLIAEILWQIYENVLFIEPYPSMADIFYFGFYPFAIYHIVTNIKGFEVKITNKTKAWMILVPALIIGIYSTEVIMKGEEIGFDYYYSMIFVTTAAISTSFAILGTLTFRKGAFAVVWSLLATGVLFHVFADVWYYNLEVFSQYTDTHVVNAFWQVGWMMIVYSLYKHQKVL